MKLLTSTNSLDLENFQIIYDIIFTVTEGNKQSAYVFLVCGWFIILTAFSC